MSSFRYPIMRNPRRVTIHPAVEREIAERDLQGLEVRHLDGPVGQMAYEEAVEAERLENAARNARASEWGLLE